jgi:hypothetical protein
MKKLLAGLLLLTSLLASCTALPNASSGKTSPAINNITTSTQSFSIDCVPTSVTVSANITDVSGIDRAQLWYRVGNDQAYTAVDMARQSGDTFSVTVKGLDIPVGEYGVWEFYITANDKAGNQSKSSPDASVQLLPCVSH